MTAPNFTVNVGSLRSRLGFIGRAIGNSTIQPILGALQIKITAQSVQIASYNLDACTVITLDPESVELPPEGPKSYEMCPPARLLTDILAKLPGEADITFTLTEETEHLVTLECGGFACTVKGFDPVEYPKLPCVQTEEATLIRTLPLGEIRTGLEKVLFAVATEETKQILTGVYCEFFRHGIRLTATDGHRVSRSGKIGMDNHPEMGEKVYTTVFSRAVLDLLVAMPGADEVQLTIKLDERRAEFNAAKVTASANLIVGQYPNVEPLINPPGEPWGTSLRVERIQLLSAVERCQIVANATENRVVILDIKTSKLVLYANTETANIHEKLSCRLTTGQEQQIAFNCKYLFAALKAARSEIVDVLLKNDKTVGKVLAADDPAHEQLIAQIHIRKTEKDEPVEPDPLPEEPEEEIAEVDLLDLEDKPITPALSAYIELKKEYPEHLLLMRLNDFYEAFGTDAQKLAKATNLIQTHKLVANHRLPMAGVPHHALPRFLPMLNSAAHRVAVAETGGVVRLIEPETPEPETPALEDADIRSYEILTVVPPSDANFKACLKEASIPALEAAIDFASSVDGHKTRLKQLQNQLKKLTT